MSILGNLANAEIRNFLGTVTIKNSYFADRSRSQEIRLNSGYLVPSNELPYYKHMAGEYILMEDMEPIQVTNPSTGVAETQTYKATSLLLNANGEQVVEVENRLLYTSNVFDEMMYVTSLDTREEIPFTLENLHAEFASDPSAVHTKTLEAYKLPGRYFDLLCQRYPKQVDLIKAIVYPVKKAREITAQELTNNEISGALIPSLNMRRKDYLVSCDNFTILSYDETLLEDGERFDLVSYMKALVEMINHRWNIKEFAVEQNYSTVLWTLLWCELYTGLIVKRYENIKTPFVHSSHVWDYLISKGLESYSGYLSTKWTQFLYKNIDYILANRGRQLITNILLDEFIEDAGMDLKTKTIVLDTSKALDRTGERAAANTRLQCQTCSRRSICKKGITNYACPDYIGIDTQCVPEPVVLTEEFTGVSKSKIIAALVSKYGYTEEQAATKLNRSRIWKDAEIEEIKDAYDRDQLTDVSKTVGTLDDLIKREYEAHLEPVYNEAVVAEQTKQLQHITGTVAPTKIIEMIKNTPSPKYTELFHKFVVQTLFHLAPKMTKVKTTAGEVWKLTEKVTQTYPIAFNGVGSAFQMSHGEMLAMLYLSIVRESRLDCIYDHVMRGSTYQADETYFRTGKTDEEVEKLTNGSRLKRLVAGVDYEVGATVNESNIYRWAPVDNLTGTDPKMIDGHENLTHFSKQFTYDFPIPGHCQCSAVFRFGRPVSQEALVQAWFDPSCYRYDAFLTHDFDLENDTTEIKPITINGLLYFVEKRDHVATEGSYSIWDGYPYELNILGIVKNGSYFSNENFNIVIIPEFVEWNSDHLLVDDSTTTPVVRPVEYIPDGALPLEGELDPSDVTVVSGTVAYDLSKETKSQRIRISQFFDVNGFLSRYIDKMELITEQKDLGHYITVMFDLLEKALTIAESSDDIRVRMSVQAVLDMCLIKDNTAFQLVENARETVWPIEQNMQFASEENCEVCLYSNWILSNPDLQATIRAVDNNQDAEQLWSDFATTCIDSLLEGTNLPYITSIQDANVQAKLKQLVTQLSSYKITFLEFATDVVDSINLPAVVSSSSSTTITGSHQIHVSPIVDSLCAHHVGAFTADDNGKMFIRTEDIVAVPGKIYFTPITTTEPEETVESEERQYIANLEDLGTDFAGFEEVVFSEETPIVPYQYYEAVTLDSIIAEDLIGKKVQLKRENNVWYYRSGVEQEMTQLIPATLLDKDRMEVEDPFVAPWTLTAEEKEKLARVRLVREQKYTGVKWNDWKTQPGLEKYLDRLLIGTVIANRDRIQMSDMLSDGPDEITTT